MTGTILVSLALAATTSWTCPPIAPQHFWLPADVEHARQQFIDKALRMNEAGECVVDGWFGRNEGKFYYTVVTPYTGNIGRVVEFTLEELKE